MAGAPPSAHSMPSFDFLHRFHTAFHGLALKFSPYNQALSSSLVAIASGQYFGLAGNGRLEVRQVDASAPAASFITPQALCDLCWSECSPHQVLTASADGAVSLWDLRASDGFPLLQCYTHKQEASAVCWDAIGKLSFISASWDGNIVMYDAIGGSVKSVQSLASGQIFEVDWHPRDDKLMAIAAANGALLHDVASGVLVQTIKASKTDVLSVSWNKYKPTELATAGSDKLIRIWDTRNLAYPVKAVSGHTLPIRRIKYSPFDENKLLSASYDGTVRQWHTGVPELATGDLCFSSVVHKEFVSGLDWDLATPGLVGSCGWDGYCQIWQLPGL